MLVQLQAGAAQAQAQMLVQLQAGAVQAQAQVQAQMLAQLHGALAAHGIVTVDQRCTAARRANAVASDAPYVVLPRADGIAPVSWPAGLNLQGLRQLNKQSTSALLLEFGQNTVGTLDALRLRLAHFIGTAI